MNTSTLDAVQDFQDSWLPQRPFASDDLTAGIYRTSREDAMTKRFIETSPASVRNLIVVDVDVEHGRDHILSRVWDDEAAPEPSFITTNPSSTHAQAIYVIEGSVNSSTKAGAYAKHVGAQLTHALNGDQAYGGLIMRNPALHVFERVSERVRTLKQLQEGMAELDRLFVKPPQAAGEGRNVDLFNSLRVYAYRRVRALSWDLDTLTQELHARAAELNLSENLTHPEGLLPQSEINATIKSIVKFVGRKFNEESFRNLQSARASKRWAKTEEARSDRNALIAFLREEGFSWEEIGAELGVKPTTLRAAHSRYMKQQKDS